MLAKKITGKGSAPLHTAAGSKKASGIEVEVSAGCFMKTAGQGVRACAGTYGETAAGSGTVEAQRWEAVGAGLAGGRKSSTIQQYSYESCADTRKSAGGKAASGGFHSRAGSADHERRAIARRGRTSVLRDFSRNQVFEPIYEQVMKRVRM